MRQTGQAKHQAQCQRDGIDRVLQQLAGGKQHVFQLVDFNRLGSQRVEAEAELRKRQHGDDRAAEQQQAGLDDLHPGGGNHAAEGHVNDHQATDHDHGDVVVQPEQQLDQLAGTDHLHDQVEAHHRQRANGRHGADFALVQPVGGDVGKGELAQVAKAFGHQKQDDGPADKEGNHEQIAVVAVGEHQRGQAEQGGRRHVVASHRQAILKAGDAAACGVEVRRGLGAAGRPVGDAQRHADKHGEHDDGRNVERLLLRDFHRASSHCRAGGAQGQQASGQLQKGFLHHFFAFMDSRNSASVSASNSELARMT